MAALFTMNQTINRPIETVADTGEIGEGTRFEMGSRASQNIASRTGLALDTRTADRGVR